MKKEMALILLTGLALGPLACGKNISPTATQTLLVAFPTTSPTPTGTPTSTPSGPTPTATPSGWNILGPVTLVTGAYSFGYVHVHPSGVLNVNGAVTLSLSGYFTLDAGATVLGDGAGYSGGAGPGADSYQGFGGSHGGQGGGPGGLEGLPANDNSMGPTLMGSGGSAGACSTTGGNGGALFLVEAPQGGVTLNGLVSMNGMSFAACSPLPVQGSGGGAGGSIYVMGGSITGSGTLQAKGAGGGGGGSSPIPGTGGGGGGGGIIVLSDHTGDNFTGAVSVQGGPGGGGGAGSGSAGQAGTFNETNF